LDLLGHAEEILDMVPHLVRDDVRLCKIAGCAQPLLQIPEEPQIEIQLLVRGTVEGAHGRLRRAASRLHGAGEEHEPGFAIAAALLPEDAVPGVLGVGQDDLDEVDQALLLG
jgi:hypothetical protein